MILAFLEIAFIISLVVIWFGAAWMWLEGYLTTGRENVDVVLFVVPVILMLFVMFIIVISKNRNFR